MAINLIKQINLANKRVLLRTDFNVPLSEQKIMNDYRLKMALPTINYLLEQKCTITIATHIGRPTPQQQENFINHALSTKILFDWFKQHNFNIYHEPNLEQARLKSYELSSAIILLENIRFFDGERTPSMPFAKQLAATGDIYINDAFGMVHREDTSVTLVPKLFEKRAKGIGLLIEHEMNELAKIQSNPRQPFVLVLGGCKISKKIPMIDYFLSNKAHRAETILLGGMIALVFLKVLGLFNGDLDIEPAVLAWAKTLSKKAAYKQIEFILPTDLVWHTKHSTTIQTTSLQGLNNVSDIAVVDIGPETIKIFVEKINNAETIFANGTMGIYEEHDSSNGSKEILTAIAQSRNFAIIGGGDTVAAAHLFGIADQIDFCSTGGGATLAFLACQNPHQELSGLMHL